MLSESCVRTNQESPLPSTSPDKRPFLKRVKSVGKALAVLALSSILLLDAKPVFAEGQTPAPADTAPAEPEFEPNCDQLTLEEQRDSDLCKMQISSNGQQFVISRSPNTAYQARIASA